MATATEWDYSTLAAHYDSRAEYAKEAIDGFVVGAGLSEGHVVADLGAGTGKLAKPLAERGLVVHAVEPNAQMRSFGVRNTKGLQVSWREGTGERTGLESTSVRAVTFGSSFNVVDQKATLAECRRIVGPRGWFCCMWNHRDLNDALQERIEAHIRGFIPDYQYGTRRDDPTAVLTETRLFEEVESLRSSFTVSMTREAVLDAWRSHATLARQAGSKFDAVLDAIGREVTEAIVNVPYTTRAWYARFNR